MKQTVSPTMGIITPVVMRFFQFLKELPPQCWVGDRITHQESEQFRSDPEGAVAARVRLVDTLMCIYVVVELALGVFAAFVPSYWKLIPALLASLRIINILEVTVNIALFDTLRTDMELRVASIARTLTLSFVNFMELIFCFSVLYIVGLSHLTNVSSACDAYYFSTITQLTIGYGDVAPKGWVRLLAGLHGLVGVTFNILILGRVLALLPVIRSIAREEHQSNADSAS